jgi:hypothetical protein
MFEPLSKNHLYGNAFFYQNYDCDFLIFIYTNFLKF